MAEPEKFLFDTQFDLTNTVAPQETPEEAVEKILRAEFEEKLRNAQQSSHKEGYDEGKTEALKEIEAQIAKTLEILIEKADTLFEDLEKKVSSIRVEAVEIALIAAKKLSRDLIQDHPTAALEALFAETIDHIRTQPHITVSVPEDQSENMEQRLQATAADRGFAGKISVSGEPKMTCGDFHIEWPDGALTLDNAAISKQVSEVVERYLAKRAGNQVDGQASKPTARHQSQQKVKSE